jgi:hypothetical protein
MNDKSKILHILNMESLKLKGCVQPRIIATTALDAVHGSPAESRVDFTMPFPVPASRYNLC